MSQDKLLLVRQALAAAESSIKTAKQLLSEIESGGLHISAKDLPGLEGVFDGVGMISESGEKIEIPANYASKSMLVVGDTLKQIDDNGTSRFKQIEHVKRHKTTGILHKKDGKFKVITPEGSYNVLEAAVEHFNGDVGDEVVLHLPAGNLTASYGAIERVVKSGDNNSLPSSPASSVKEPQAEGKTDLVQPEREHMEEKPAVEKPPSPALNNPTPKQNEVMEASSNKPKKKKKKKPVGLSNAVTSTPPVERPQPVRAPIAPAAPSVPMPAPGEDDELR